MLTPAGTGGSGRRRRWAVVVAGVAAAGAACARGRTAPSGTRRSSAMQVAHGLQAGRADQPRRWTGWAGDGQQLGCGPRARPGQSARRCRRPGDLVGESTVAQAGRVAPERRRGPGRRLAESSGGARHWSSSTQALAGRASSTARIEVAGTWCALEVRGNSGQVSGRRSCGRWRVAAIRSGAVARHFWYLACSANNFVGQLNRDVV